MSDIKFLERVALEILNRDRKELLETVIVFPNKRPEIFLKKYLKNRVSDAFWIPDVRSIEEFVVELSPIAIQDPMLTWFELFEIHKRTERDKARQPDEFINWAPTMLNDFNDADLALADIKELFSFLSQAKALERWHPDGGELTDFEKAYLDFYQKLFQYYELLKKSLTEKGMGTKGMVYRGVAENIEKQEKFPWKHIIFAGFNALTKSEEKLIVGLRKMLPVSLFWDADEYYVNAAKHGLPWQEAGRFMQKNFKNLKLSKPQWVGSSLMEGEKSISLVAAPGQISQVKYTGQLMEQLTEKSSDFSPTDTAIVLADENMLIPLLTSLPTGSLSYNVTMGYPLALSHLAQALSLWVELLIRQGQRKSRTFNTALLLSLLQSSVVRFLLYQPDEIVSKITNLSAAFIDVRKLEVIFSKRNEMLFNTLFNFDNKVSTVFNQMMKLLSLYKGEIDFRENREEKKLFGARNPMIKQEVSAVFQVLKKLHTILSSNEANFNLKVLQRIFSRLLGNSEISLKGEPLDGIQVMGMLETRLLDFKRVIVLSANEGDLPKNNSLESFIPFDIRREYSLPLPDEKNAIYAYYFFRLLQRAEEVELIYNSEIGDLGGGEKSRFLFQLEMEAAGANSNLHIHEKFLKLENRQTPEAITISIPKTGTALGRLEEIGKKGFSPSALNQYIDCPLKFYFSRVLKLRPPVEMRANIESDVFGNIVHEVLENIYYPDLNKPIDIDRLVLELKKLDDYLDESLKKNYSTGDIHHGKNLLIVKVIRKYIERFVKKDISNLKKEPRILLGIEQELVYPIDCGGKQVFIRGKIDRIDKSGSLVRVSDYKTGSVTKTDVNFKEWNRLLTESKYSKAFQTLAYGWLYKQSFPSETNIEVGLYSLRNLSEGFISPKFPEETLDEWQDDFEEVLADLLKDIFNHEVPFDQTENHKNCQYCDYKGVCNR